jgi:hypothetical protein
VKAPPQKKKDKTQTPRLVGACEKQARGFLGGALRCLACSESPSPKKKRQNAFFARAPTADPIYDNEAATANGGMPHAAGATPIWCI